MTKKNLYKSPRKYNPLPSCELLRSLFDYDEKTGIVTNKTSTSNRIKVGDVVKGGGRYLRVGIKGKRYALHRLIWKMYYGETPDEIDHINGDKHDNRLENLRNIAHHQNQKNTSLYSHNTSGIMGVRWSERDRKWQSYIRVCSRLINLGLFKVKEDAIEARKRAENEYGFHPNHGRETTKV